MPDNRKQLIPDLDFDLLKAYLSAFIANNSDFTDYNFNGSGLSMIMDLLAHNTHFNAFLLNMGINENFIDTAVTRGSIVSLAKNFGYCPRSVKSSIAKISFNIDSSDALGSTLTLETYVDNDNLGNYFTGESGSSTYVFYPIESVTATADSNGIYTFNNVLIREGAYNTLTYTVIPGDSGKYFINNFDIDIDSLRVKVTYAEDNSVEVFTKIENLVESTATSPIYYLFETTDRRYYIQFGDGVIGKKLSNNDVITIDFQTSSGSDANDISDFVLATDLTSSVSTTFSDSNLNFTNVVNSYGGASEESLDSIRINALGNFRSQNRAVTAEDYKYFVSRDYPLAQTISVWGGQDADPPQYGKVFISFKPSDGFFISNAQKQELLNSILDNRNIVSVIPEIVDPEYIFLQIDSLVNYNKATTNYSAVDIQNLVTTTIRQYNSSYLTLFGTKFNYSKFIREIDDTDASIVSNITNIKLRKNVPIVLSSALRYEIDFQNSLHPGTVGNISPFKATGDVSLGSNASLDLFLQDNELGVMQVVRYDLSGNKFVLKENCGEVDYVTGKIILNNFYVSQTANIDNTINIVARPKDYAIGDITSKRNTILTIVDSDITVNARSVS